MPDPAITAHLRILDNLQAVGHHLITDLGHQDALPPDFTLACRGWLLHQLSTLALHQQVITARGGLSRRVAMYDDILYTLSEDRDLIVYHAPQSDHAPMLRAMSERISAVRRILLDFTPQPGSSQPDPIATGLAHLIQLSTGPMSTPGAMAGLVGWWTHLHNSAIALDLDTHRLSLGVEGATQLVAALAEVGAPLGHLRRDITVSWGSARGVSPRSGPPEVWLCAPSNKACFVEILHKVPAMTARSPQNTPLIRR
jgi:hypothetical protein